MKQRIRDLDVRSFPTLLFIKALRQRIISCWHFVPIGLVGERPERHFKHTARIYSCCCFFGLSNLRAFLFLEFSQQIQKQSQPFISKVLYPTESERYFPIH